VDSRLWAEVTAPGCIPGSLIKGVSSTAVYYCGRDGRRYVFPNQQVFFTWYSDFSTVITINDTELSALRIGGLVNYRPGVRMVKIQSDPKTYVVSRTGTLRWVPSEGVAATLYGSEWNTMIDDVSDAFFFNYNIGESVTLSL
jgi:hypothetical protein